MNSCIFWLTNLFYLVRTDIKAHLSVPHIWKIFWVLLLIDWDIWLSFFSLGFKFIYLIIVLIARQWIPVKDRSFGRISCLCLTFTIHWNHRAFLSIIGYVDWYKFLIFFLNYLTNLIASHLFKWLINYIKNNYSAMFITYN